MLTSLIFLAKRLSFEIWRFFSEDYKQVAYNSQPKLLPIRF